MSKFTTQLPKSFQAGLLTMYLHYVTDYPRFANYNSHSKPAKLCLRVRVDTGFPSTTTSGASHISTSCSRRQIVILFLKAAHLKMSYMLHLYHTSAAC